VPGSTAGPMVGRDRETTALAAAQDIPSVWAGAADRDSSPPYGQWRLALDEPAVRTNPYGQAKHTCGHEPAATSMVTPAPTTPRSADLSAAVACGAVSGCDLDQVPYRSEDKNASSDF
jgi:hypothetical protein